jgi:hypothetical protein
MLCLLCSALPLIMTPMLRKVEGNVEESAGGLCGRRLSGSRFEFDALNV